MGNNKEWLVLSTELIINGKLGTVKRFECRHFERRANVGKFTEDVVWMLFKIQARAYLFVTRFTDVL